jgi:hypothetical protein
MTKRLSLLPASILCGALLLNSTGPNSAQAIEPDAAKTKTTSDVATDQDDPLSLYLRTSVYSAYVFRGLNLYDGMSIQPSMGAAYDMGDIGRIGASVWMHLPAESGAQDTIDLTGITIDTTDLFAPKTKFFELDPTISYDVTWDMVTVSAGHTWYTDPNEGQLDVILPVIDDEGFLVDAETFSLRASRGDTSEFYFGISLDTYLNPEFTYVSDYRLYDYQYYTLTLSQSFPVSADGNFEVKPYVTFGWSTGNDSNFEAGATPTGIYDKNGLEHVNIGLTGQVFVEGFAIKPSINYVFVNDKALGSDDIVWGGFDIDFDI